MPDPKDCNGTSPENKRIGGSVLHRVRARLKDSPALEEIFSTTSKAHALDAVQRMKMDPDYSEVFYIDPDAPVKPTEGKTP